MKDLVRNSAEVLGQFYARYLLKDLMAKIVPGLAVLICLCAIVVGPDECGRLVAGLRWYHWILLAFPSWVLGFAVQGIGEKTGYIHTWPINRYGKDKIGEYYALYFRCDAGGTEEEKNQIDRFAVIHEAGGNASLAIVICLFLLLFDFIVEMVTPAGERVSVKRCVKTPQATSFRTSLLTTVPSTNVAPA